jgi:hypothetical protein
MRVLLDQGLPRSAAGLLCNVGIDAMISVTEDRIRVRGMPVR